MSDTNLKQKLEVRRKTIQSKSPSDVEDTQLPDDSMVEELTQQLSHAMEDEEKSLKLTLQQRREKSKILLQEKEQGDDSQYPMFSKQKSTSSGLDHGQSDLSSRPQTPSSVPGSPRTEFGSRSSTPFGKLSTDAKSRLKSQLQQRMSAKRSTLGVDSERFERSRRLRDRVTRSTRLVNMGRERDTEAKLISQIESTLKLKRADDKIRKERGEPNEEDCYDFFTKQYEDVPEEEMATEEPDVTIPMGTGGTEPSLQDSQLPIERQEDTEMIEEVHGSIEPMPAEELLHAEADWEDKKLLGDIIAKDLDWHMFNITAAEYTTHNIQMETERLTYFIPSRLPPSITRKVDANTVPRNLEDEGIFVGEKPVVLPTNVNILEHRLLTEPDRGQKWFGVDGKVDSLANPVKQVITKPWLDDEYDLDDNLQTVYVKAHLPASKNKYLDDSAGEIELQINLGSVVFLHHPLMSKEHVLASNITQMYDEYIEMKHNNYVSFFVDKLAALRNAIADLKDQSFPRVPGDTSLHESRVYDYLCEIRRTTRQLNVAESTERDLMRRIIEEWNHIKKLRENQRYVNTTVKLTIKKEQINKEEDKKEWLREVKVELKERREEYATTVIRKYEKEMEKYRSQLQTWKKNRMKIKEQRKKDAETTENLLETKEVDDSEITIAGNVDKPQKPDKPADFDEEQSRSEIMKDLIESRRNPGEDKISLLLANTGSVSPPSAIPDGEAARRRAVLKTSILLKVKFNGREVFSTDPRFLSTDFKLNFGLIFRIRIVHWPESLKVQFLDAGVLAPTTFSEVFLRIPDTRIHSSNVQLGLVRFSSDQAVAGEHTSVGSNNPFTLRLDDRVPTSCNTHGQLICCVSWGLSESGQVLAPKGAVDGADPYAIANDPKSKDPISYLGAEAIQDRDLIKKWVQDNPLDPNDPDNAALVPFIEDAGGHTVYHALDYFRLEQLMEEFNFLTDEQFDQLNRFRLLRLRSEEVPEFRNLNLIPCQETEILDSIFTPYERRLKEKAAVLTEGERFVESGNLSAHRVEVLQYRARVHDEVMNRFFAARHYRTYEDVVHEEQVPDIKTLGFALGKAVEPRRPLKPVRKERKKATGQALTEGSVNILVTVVRGHNLPTRRDFNPAATMGQLHGPITLQAPPPPPPSKKLIALAPFVAVSFQDNVVTSRVAQGPTPSWNEELKVPFSAPNSDYSSSNIQTVDDVLFIHLFDRHVEDLPPTEEDPSLFTKKITNHWLGSFKLPFSTLYQRGNVDGTFKLKVPPVLLGYDLKEPQSFDTREVFDQQFTNHCSGTYLTLFITLDPILRPADPVKGPFTSKEDDAILSKCASFLAECQRKFPQRNVKTTVIDLKGESVLITRYASPLQPPAELTEGSEFASLQVAERIARFVSLIPFSSDNVTFAGVCDLWSTCEQFIHMLKGDEEEHAVLLLNYFLHLGKKAYLVLGSAIPEGNTAYVLTMESVTQEIYLWNASTGEHFSHRDGLCPFKSVGSLVDDKNIWFNVQPHDLTSKLRFDVSQSSDWKALFPSPPPGGIPTIQPATLYYVATDSNFVARLTHNITETLKKKLMEWRPRHVTRWNRPCNSVLLEILKDLESQYVRRGQADLNHTTQLLERMGEFRITGFPMDMSYTDIDSIVTAVRSTEVHKIQDPDIAFSLAVYIHPYPASVLAVWVYVAALVGRR